MSTQPAAAAASCPRHWRPHWFVVVGLVLGLSLAVYTHVFFNFHTVVSGVVFRSAQPTAAGLERYLQRYHFHTVINLRGPNPDDTWYREEKEILSRHGVRFVDLPTDSKSTPNPNELRQLASLLESRDAAPILIHCFWGVERTAALSASCILLLEECDALARARAQLTWRSGNFFWMKGTQTNLAFIDRYERWLVVNRLAHSPAHFRNWALGIARSQP